MNFTRQKRHRALAFRYYKKAYGYIRADYRRCHFGPHDDVLKNLIIKFPPLIEDCNDNFMEATYTRSPPPRRACPRLIHIQARLSSSRYMVLLTPLAD